MRAGAACIAQRRGLFRTSLRIMTVLLAICALLIRTLVLRMIRFPRNAESALACRMSDCLAFGTDAIRTRVRVSALSCRDAYRAACVLVVIRLARIAENALARHMSGHGTWNKCASDTRSCCESVQTRRIPCNTLGNPRILSHAHQNHSKRTPCLEFHFPFLIFSYCSGRYRPR